MSKASQYSELATGMYGSSMIYGVMGEIDSPDDVKRLLNGKKDREGYKQAFLDHAHLAADAILYTNWGCEDCQSLALTTASGVEITAPPYFLVRHDATRSIVLCVRGTWNIKDFITDFKCCGVAWERGKAHEGIALVVDSLLEDEELNEAIAAVLPRLQAAVVALDWAAVTNLVVRLLQGAGQSVSPEDAILAALEMGDAKTDAKAEVDVKTLEVVRAEVVRYHEGVESTNVMVFGAGSNVFTEYEVEVESATGVKWLVYRRYTHFK